MTTARFIITILSGTAAAACFISVCIFVAEAWERRAVAKWWRDRDPNWVDPMSEAVTEPVPVKKPAIANALIASGALRRTK